MPTHPTGTQGTTSSTAAQPPASAAGGPAAPIPQKSARERLEAFASGENIKDAGHDLQESIDHLAEAAEAFKSGDTLGGTAMVMRGIGALSGTLALVAPPVGALVGALLGAITSLIAAILEAMKPQSESLEQKLKRFIEEESLSNAYIAMSAGKAEWEVAEMKIYMLAEQRQRAADLLAQDDANPQLSVIEREQLMRVCEGRSWEYLTQNIGWERHKARISASFAALAKKRDLASTEWLALFDITMNYALRFWIAFESMAGLVGGDGSTDEHAPAYNNAQLFHALRRVVARQLQEDIESVYFEAQNKAQIYHLWSGVERRQNIGRRVGVSGQTVEPTQWLGGKSSSFAVSSGGTIFSSGITDGKEPLYVGRGGAESWQAAPGAEFCDQVFTAELGEPGEVLVMNLHSYGQRLSYAIFNDMEGHVGEDSKRDWTPNAQRWGGWGHLDFTSQHLTILFAALKSMDKTSMTIHALGVHEGSHEVQLYEVHVGADVRVASAGPDFTFSHAEVVAELGDHPLWRRSDPTRCAISYFLGEPVVQLGALVRGRAEGSPFTWDLRRPEHLDGPVVVHQGRFFQDLTFVCATEQGLFMRCRVNPQDGMSWVVDRKLQTSWVWKQASTEVMSAYNLFYRLRDVAKG